MSLNAFDAAKHHIGLGPAAEYGFMLVGSYAKDVQRDQPSGEYGGDTDLIQSVPSLSRWTQDDFSGGCFQSRFDRDSAAFFDSKGFIPADQSRSVVSVPPVVFKKAFNPAAQSNPASRTNLTAPVAMFVISHSIYVVFEHGILRYRQDTDTNSWYAGGVDANTWIADAAYDKNEQMLYLLCNSTIPGDRPFLRRLNTDGTNPTNQQIYLPPTTTENLRGYGMQIGDQYIAVAIGLKLWVADPPINTTSAAGDATWTKIGRLPGYWRDSVAYNGMTYILCGNTDESTSLVAFDGTAVLPIVDFPYNFRGKCLKVFGGRLFVGGSGTNLDGSERYAELHEVTGSSTRMIRSFLLDSFQSAATFPTTIRDLAPTEGLLWLAEDNVRLWAYDLTSDGFFGASEIQGSAGLKFYRFAHGRERLFIWGANAGDTTKNGLYRVAAAGTGGDTPTAYTCTLTTADFCVEPAVDKRWSEIVVQSRFGAPTISYSTDGGTTFTACAVTTTTTGTLNITRADLSGLALSRAIRFKFSFSRGTDVDTFAELMAYTVAFTFAGSSSQKHAWNLTVNASAAIEGRDGTTVAQDVATFISTLWGYADARTKLQFKDLDGAVKNVQILHMTESLPVVGPNASTRPEAYLALTLIEV